MEIYLDQPWPYLLEERGGHANLQDRLPGGLSKLQAKHPERTSWLNPDIRNSSKLYFLCLKFVLFQKNPVLVKILQ